VSDQCFWKNVGPCAGESTNTLMFNSQIRGLICSNHIKHQKYVTLLLSYGFNVDTLFDLTPEQAEQAAIKLAQEKGLNIEDTIL
jgi:hypothetical protein